ncbi:sulfotransferase [Sphingomonas sp. URHD0057]|uniref:sulfotransferase n=1 Tax=Sphingomonas sp. URHD0057 TaxID=1380389 RepID=UPI000A6CD6CF|nr:sulfotransferase [Sphingomonas sp. URHD0057]
MKLMVIGFPKSGTTSLTEALTASGFRPAHWRTHAGRFVGSLIYQAIYRGLEPFALLERYDAITQADVCLPSLQLNFWPNLDFAVLSAIRRAHPTCLLLLNYRRPEAIADGIMKWDDLQQRVAMSSIPGLPVGVGDKREELITWIENHFDACRRFFAGDEHFLELDIESAVAPARLSKALGMEIVGWADRKAVTYEDELAVLPPGKYRDIRKG